LRHTLTNPVRAGDLPLGDLQHPTSVFIAGPNRSMLKWVAFSLVAPHASRVYWTEIQLTGEALDPLDPLALHVIPEERLHVIHPNDLQSDEQDARRAETAVTTMVRSDEPPENLRRISDFFKLPPRTQARISSTSPGPLPPILIASNGHRLAGLYPSAAIGPMVRSFLESGATLFLLWADAPPERRAVFDVVLHVEGTGPSQWREATVRCEKGLSTGPLASGTPCRLADLPPIAAVLERSIRPPVGR